MKSRTFVSSILWLGAFAVWTAIVCTVDVQATGPCGTSVGLAGLNMLIHRLTGVHLALYAVTDWLSLIPLGTCACFGALGLLQWIKRKRLMLVDSSLLMLGGLYILVIAAYCVFERLIVNYRPVLIGGALEASYPSSTTLLVLCVMPTAAMQLRARMKSRRLNNTLSALIAAFTALMILGRFFSGVHWFSDIVGGILLGSGLNALYAAAAGLNGR